MTANQIAYQNYLELVRSNKAKEAEAYRSNVERERHNWAALAETQRYNTNTYNLGTRQQAERERANQVAETLSRLNLNEMIRNNSANIANQQFANQTARYNAATQRLEHDLNTRKLDEQKRVNNANFIIGTTNAANNQSIARANRETTRSEGAANRQNNIWTSLINATSRLGGSLINSLFH